MDDHDTRYEILCGACHTITLALLPLLVCPACHAHAVVAVASDLPPLDTSEAFRPESPHWGSHPSPTAKVVERDEAKP